MFTSAPTTASSPSAPTTASSPSAPTTASSPSAPTTASSPSAPTTAEEKSSPTINKRSRIGFFAGGTLLGGVTGLALGPLGFPDWVNGWTLSDLDMSVAAAPLATILSASGVIVAAGIAFRNGEKNRNQEREIQKETAKRETERSLRDRFFKITETLSEGSEYVKREAGVYALIALADDWAAFHRDDPNAAQREQQTCLNVITGQLRDPSVPILPKPILALKQRKVLNKRRNNHRMILAF